MNRRLLLYAVTAIIALVGASCTSPGGEVAQRPQNSVTETTTTGQQAVPPSTTAESVPSVNAAALEFWSTAVGFYTAATEAERFNTLNDIARDSSVAVLARVVEAGPSRVLTGDGGGEDVLVYNSVVVEILDVLSGHMSDNFRAGDRLVIEQVALKDEAIGTTAVLFLRDKQDMFGLPPEASPHPEEKGLYRLVSSQGVFIDRGDGIAVNPIIEMMRFLHSSESGTSFTDFVLDDSIRINPAVHPIAAQVKEMTLTELVDLVASIGD